MQDEIEIRLKQFRQMGRHDLQSYLLMTAPNELADEAVDEIEAATLKWMNGRLHTIPFEFLTASEAFYYFMRKSFQHAEAHLWRQAWNNAELNESIQADLLKVLDVWVDDSVLVEEEIVREFQGDNTLNNYRIGGESFELPASKMLMIARAVRNSVMLCAEDHGVLELFEQLPADPTPEGCK
jgi:hypothetical protein